MSLYVGRTRIIVHPLALLYPLAAVMLGTGAEAAALMIALAFHEAAHLMAAHALGVGVASLRLTPFGGAMAMENPYSLSPLRLAMVSAAGPLANALLTVAAAFLCVWEAARRFIQKPTVLGLCLTAAAVTLGSHVLMLEACADRYHLTIACMQSFFFLVLWSALAACRQKAPWKR